MKGARLLVQDYYITKNKKSKSLAEKVINYVISYQNDDGSWCITV